MKLFDKILLGLLSAAAMLAGVILTMCALGWGFHLHLSRGGTLLFVILAAVLVLLSVRMFFVVFKKVKPDAGVLVQTTNMGSAYMTFGAIEGVIRRYLSQQPEIKACGVTLSAGAEDKLAVGLRLTIFPDAPIAPLAARIQQGLKAHLESVCGVKVGEIAVLVESATAMESISTKAIEAPRVK